MTVAGREILYWPTLGSRPIPARRLSAVSGYLPTCRFDRRQEVLMAAIQKITPFLWFDNQAEEAAKYYVSIFKNSKIGNISRYGEAGKDVHKRPPGSVLVVEFTLEGQRFMALNGGPQFKFNEAISLLIGCKDQAEIDYYWDKLTRGGDPAAQQCGWLKDKYGVSWQVALEGMEQLVGDPSDPGSQRAMEAMMEMRKIDVAKLEEARAGAGATA
jgi:predicted 3-demethylubiquinone-9 3-methyltransferase (glyoxalase superfamily)